MPGPGPYGPPPGPVCRICGGGPAVAATIRGHRGFIIVMRFLKTPGPFCRTCGTAVVRDMSAKTLLLGWWGIVSLFATPVTLIINLVQWQKIKKLPPRLPYGPGQPLDPGKPLLRRPAALGLLVPAAVILLIIIGAVASRSDPSNASVGDCIHQTGSTSAKIVGCSSDDAEYIVLDRVKSESLCALVPGVEATYSEIGGSSDFVLCLGDVP